jgi:hypothetical protein
MKKHSTLAFDQTLKIFVMTIRFFQYINKRICSVGGLPTLSLGNESIVPQ